MPLFPSDFKKFKHVSSDDKTTTLEHPKGHTITIMHSALGKDMRAQLQALYKNSSETKDQLQDQSPKLADGGVLAEADRKGYLGTQRKVDQELRDKPALNQAPKNNGDDVRSPQQKEDQKAQNIKYGYQEGGEVQMYAEGTPKQPIQQDPSISEQEQVNPEMVRQRELYNKLIQSGTVKPETEMPVAPDTQMFGPKGEAPANFSPQNWGAAQQMYQREKSDNAAQIAQTQQQAIKVNESRVSAGLQPVPVPNVPEGPQIPGSETNPTQATPPDKSMNPTAPSADLAQQPQQGSMNDPMGMMQKGYESQLGGIKQQELSQQNLGEMQAQVLSRAQQSETDAKIAYKQHYDDLESERKNLISDIQEGHVDPEKYWTGDKNGNGGHSKIMSVLGIILAGFNPTNSPNAALKALDFQMEQNLQAQKENLGAKKSLLAENLRQFGNLRDATEFTRIQQNDMIQNKLQQAAATVSSPMAKAAAMQAAGQLQMQTAPMFQKFVLNRTVANLQQQAQQDPSKIPAMLAAVDATDPEKGKALREKLVPGVGFANTAEDAKFLKEVEDRRKNIKRNSEEVIGLIKKHGTYEMFGSHNADLDARIDQIATDMAKMQDPTSAARPGEVELVKRSLSNAGLKTQNKTAQDQLKHFYDTVEQRANSAYSTRGMKPPNSGPLKEIKTLNGVQYQKVNGGWQKVK